jgi:hypothetical protein
MNKFVLLYFGEPNFKTAEQAKEHQAAWMKWAKGLGNAIVEMGNPAKPGKMVSKKGVSDADGADRFTGYTIIQAKNLDQAVKYTQSCPFVIDGGTMAVHEMMSMGM